MACVNPASARRRHGGSRPYFLTATSKAPPPAVSTPWVTYPDLYSASCQTADGASWLQVSTLTVAGRPLVTEPLGPTWGYHLDDVNLALGNLVDDVRAQEAAFSNHH